MKKVDARDLIGGLALVAIGVFAALYASSNYQVGTVAHMGPGFFPAALGWILAAVGAVIVLIAFRAPIHALKPPPFELRPFLSVVFAVAVFGLLVERLGLIPTTIVTVAVASVAERSFRLRKALILGVILAVLAWLIFTVGLQMTLPAFASLD